MGAAISSSESSTRAPSVDVDGDRVSITHTRRAGLRGRLRSHVAGHQAGVAPENRPSVSSAPTAEPSPTSAAVTGSISRIPGPPLGPSLRITINVALSGSTAAR